MSKIALTPNASGDGVFTITAPNSGTNRAIALPDAAGTIPLLAAASNTAITSTPAELNILDGVTSTAAELNILDGVTSTTAELNILDGVTATAAEINLIDGGTARGTTAVADGDGFLTNDGGTMRMTKVDTLATYMGTKISGHWSNLAEVTLGGSQVSTIDITLPTGYDVLKLDIRFPVCVGSTNRSVRMQLLDSNGAARSFGYQTDLFVTNETPSQQQSRYGSTLTLSPPYGENSGDYCFYRLQFFDVDSSTIHTKWQGQGSAYINANSKAGNMLSSGMQYSTAHVTPTARFSLSSSTSFNTDDGCYYRLYGHSYS